MADVGAVHDDMALRCDRCGAPVGLHARLNEEGKAHETPYP